MTSITAECISYSYGEETVFSDVSLKFEKPELVCILGPNGVGKTTLVKCFTKILKVADGKVMVNGLDIKDYGLLDLAKIMAFVPNSSSSVFSMTVSEAVMMGRHPHAGWVTSDRDMDVVDQMMHTLELQDFAERDIRELSAGQFQRVAIARGLVQEPKILIMDEPTSNLDVRNQMDVMKFLKDYAKKTETMVLMVSHDLNITASFADRIILMAEGGVYADGTAYDVLTGDNIRDVYKVESKIIDDDGRPHVILLPGR